jgi:hypothetical protein
MNKQQLIHFCYEYPTLEQAGRDIASDQPLRQHCREIRSLLSLHAQHFTDGMIDPDQPRNLKTIREQLGSLHNYCFNR